MDSAAPPPPTVVLVTADDELLDQVLAVAAAAGVEIEVVSDVGAVRSRWVGAVTVVVGVDQAPNLAALLLPRRAEAYVVGAEADRDRIHAWSVPLGAAVVLLPSGAGWLTAVLADAHGARAGAGRVVAVIAASGGAGASTLAAGLAFVTAHGGRRTLLVDGDPLGGGIDLLVGAERVPGWRWSRLQTARGHIGDLTGQLPLVDGVDVLAMGRADWCDPGSEAMKAVLLSGTRSHDLIVVDVGRGLGPAGEEAVRRADALLIVTLADLRGVAAGQKLQQRLGDFSAESGLAVRVTRPRSLGPAAAGDGLALRVVAVVPDDPSVRVGAERGDPPGKNPRSPLGRACAAVLDWVDDQGTGRLA